MRPFDTNASEASYLTRRCAFVRPGGFLWRRHVFVVGNIQLLCGDCNRAKGASR
jgi:hypothetical protein